MGALSGKHRLWIPPGSGSRGGPVEIAHSLSGTPEAGAGCGNTLSAPRDVLQCTMATHQILLRGAAQGYLLQAAVSLLDVVSASSFLGSLPGEQRAGKRNRHRGLWC